MRRIILGAALSAALLAPQGALAARRGCPHRFTVRQGMRAARAVYRGTRKVERREFFMLGRIEMCQRNGSAQPFVRWFDRRERRRHDRRVRAARRPWSYATASWYDDSGATASGWHAGYGVANLWMGFGTRVEFRYGGRVVTAVVDDRGPYVSGREFDLNAATKGALGCPDLCQVAYRVG